MTETVLLMLVVGAFLAFVNIIAFLTRTSKRNAERERFEKAVQERDHRDPAPPLARPPAVHSPFGPEAYAPAPQPAAPPKAVPQPKALRIWTAPHSDRDTPHLNQYIAWPNTKLTTPVAERSPGEHDYVWD